MGWRGHQKPSYLRGSSKSWPVLHSFTDRRWYAARVSLGVATSEPGSEQKLAREAGRRRPGGVQSCH